MRNESFKIALGRKMWQLRKLSGMNQEQVAEALGYEGSGTISQIEKGKKGMKNEKIKEAAKLFKVNPHVLMSGRNYKNDELQMHIDLETVIQQRRKSEHFEAIKSLLRLAAKEK